MEDVFPTIIGAIVGIVLSWLIAAIRYSPKHNGGGWFSFGFSQLLLMVILATIGAFVGSIVGGVY